MTTRRAPAPVQIAARTLTVALALAFLLALAWAAFTWWIAALLIGMVLCIVVIGGRLWRY